MALVYRGLFEELQKELERTLGSALGPELHPPVNVFDQGEAYVVKAKISGANPAKLEVSVEDDTLTLHGERTLGDPGAAGAYHRRERSEGQFRRVVRMPGRLAAEEARADYHDGVLTVHVAKARERQPQRIDVRAE